MEHITAIFETREDAENALAKLGDVGITERQVSLITTDHTFSNAFKIENNTKAEEGATTGAAIGGLTGAVLAALTTASATVIPGLGLVVSGYLVSALAGFGLGAAGGSIVGALVGLGFPENEAKLVEKELGRGNILLAVKPETDEQRKDAQRILDEAKDPDKLAQDVPRHRTYNNTGARTH
jgi:hypothetical protein